MSRTLIRHSLQWWYVPGLHFSEMLYIWLFLLIWMQWLWPHRGQLYTTRYKLNVSYNLVTLNPLCLNPQSTEQCRVLFKKGRRNRIAFNSLYFVLAWFSPSLISMKQIAKILKASSFALGRSGLFQQLLLLSCICDQLLPPCGYVWLLQLCISGRALNPSGYVWLLQLCISGRSLTPSGYVWFLQLSIYIC